MTAKLRKAIFPVGGLGTRFLPATKSMPKEMLPIVDKPLIQYAVEEAKAAGIEEFIFVTGRGKGAIEDHFDHSYELQETLAERGKTEMLALVKDMLLEPGQVAYIRQQEPLGLGHAVWCARNVVGNEPFAVLLADDLVKSQTPCLKQMSELWQELGGNLVAAMEVPREHTSRYGILDVVSDDGRCARAKGLVEKPAPEDAPSTLSIIGRYILHPDVMLELDNQEAGAGGEIQLTDAMARTLDRLPFHGYRFEGRRFDCGSKAGFVEATLSYAMEHEETKDAMPEMLSRIGKSK